MSNFVHIYFETQNLLVRQYTMRDIDGLYEVVSNPQVQQYTKDKNHPWDKFKTEQSFNSATEIGKELIKEAFKITNIVGIYGMAEPENIASRRVLQKIGM